MHGFYSELIYHIVLWARLNINILTLFDEQLFYYKLLRICFEMLRKIS